MIKSLWASIQGDPVFMRRVNGWLTIFWIVMIPVSVAFGLLSSVTYVSALSLWALVSGHWSAWQAARVEVEQMAQADELKNNPIERRVVDEIVAKTTVSADPSASTNDPLAGVGAPAVPSAAQSDRTPQLLQDLFAQMSALRQLVEASHASPAELPR